MLLDGQLPNSALTSVTANAVEDETGTSANWSITAHAICANIVPGLQRVAVTGPSNSASNRLVAAPCPTGKSVIGMGGTINGQGVLDALFPDPALTSASISGSEDATGNAGNWSATAYAICAASADLVTSTGIRQELIASARAVDCPSGRFVAGAGIDVSGGAGRVAAFDVIPGRSDPFFAYAGAHTISNQSADSWNISAQAICVTAFPNQAPTSVASVNDSEAEKSATVTCPAGLRVIGAGGGINHGDPTLVPANLVLETVRPNSALTEVTATAHETEEGTASSWIVDAYAVCASRPAGPSARDGFERLGIGRVRAEARDLSHRQAPDRHRRRDRRRRRPGGPRRAQRRRGADEDDGDGIEDHTGLDSNWHVTAYAICITR